MKNFRLFAIVLAAGFVLASCGKDGETATKSYSITVNNDGNGTASADVTKTRSGNTVTLTAIPNDGFEFLSWVVESGGITLENATANPAEFIMPKGEVSVKATFKEESVDDVIDDILPLIPDPMLKRFMVWRMSNAQTVNDKLYGAWDTDTNGKLSSTEAAAVVAMDISDLYSFFEEEGDPGYAESYKGLEYFPNIEYLNCGYAQLASNEDFDLSGNKKLKTIICDAVSEEIWKIDFSVCPELTYINCEDNYNLEEIDVTKCTKLVELTCFGCDYLGSLDVTNCPSLEVLNIIYCYISTIDLSKNTELVDLSINWNPMTSIDLSNNKKLILFDATSSDLTSIDLSDCTSLESLHISKCYLTELDLSSNKNLKNISCSGNLLKKLDVSNLPNLDMLSCYENELEELKMDNCPKLT